MKLVGLTLFGVGYVLGSKAGRERYEQIRSLARAVTERLEDGEPVSVGHICRSTVYICPPNRHCFFWGLCYQRQRISGQREKRLVHGSATNAGSNS